MMNEDDQTIRVTLTPLGGKRSFSGDLLKSIANIKMQKLEPG
jgi:hypothetical protein